MLVKMKHYRPLPENAEVLIRKGRQYARWTNSKGTRTTRPLNAQGDRIVVESRCWYVRLKDANGKWHMRKAYTDKTASAALEIKLVTKIERGQVGLVDPLEGQRKRPLDEHLDDFEMHLEDRGNTLEYCELTVKRCRNVFDRIKAGVIDDVTPGRIEACLADFRREGLSVSTSNHYFRALRNFCRWLVRDRRVAENPIVGMSAMKITEQDKKHRRRPLTDEELIAVIKTATLSSVAFRGLRGQDRAMLYIVASNTGLRASELASLTPESFDLESGMPTVHCLGAYTKNGQEAVLPLNAGVSGMLEGWLIDKPIGECVWPGTWANHTSAKMFRVDLNAARQAWLEEVESEQERDERERSSFLMYCDPSGRYADFHSLRHTFISNLARAGVHPKNAQSLARHSKITLTMDHYTHTVLGDLARDVENLPTIATIVAEEAEGIEALAATGTDDTYVKRCSKRRSKSGSDRQDGANRGKDWQDRPAGTNSHAASCKPVTLAEINKACQRVASPVTYEADGIRTRNIRIDSPVL